MEKPIKNNTPEEKLTYQLCIETINKIAKEYGDLHVPDILDPLIAERIDLAIQEALTKLEDLDSKTDIKLEDINKIKEDCQKIITTGNELNKNFIEAFPLLESIVAHVNDVESTIEQKAQQIQTIKEAIEVLEQTINSLVDRAALIERNIDNLYREFVEKYNHSVQIYEYILEWKEQIEHFIMLAEPVLEELKTLIPQAQEINKKLEEAIALGLDLEQVIKNAEQTIIETGQEQVSNITTTGESVLKSITTIKTEIETVTIPNANTTNEALTNVVNTGQDLLNEISNKRNESIEAIHQKELDSIKLINDTDVLIKQSLTNTAEDLTERSVTTIKAQQTTSTNEFTTLVVDKTTAFTTLFTDKITEFTKLFTDKVTAFTQLVNEKTAEFLNLPYPINFQYQQFPDKATGLFREEDSPLALFGGDWEEVEKRIYNNVPKVTTNTQETTSVVYPSGVQNIFYNPKGVPKSTSVNFDLDYVKTLGGSTYAIATASNLGMYAQTGTASSIYQYLYLTRAHLDGPTWGGTVGGQSVGLWRYTDAPITPEEEKDYVIIWKKIG